jgi:hypothetical protein
MSSILDKMIQHKVILDLNPDQASFIGTPQWVDLELRKDGELWCDLFRLPGCGATRTNSCRVRSPGKSVECRND